MFSCHVCGSDSSHAEAVSEVFHIGGKICLLENIHAIVCSRCGEEIFSRETTERVRLMLNGEDEPVRTISVDVFSFGEAV